MALQCDADQRRPQAKDCSSGHAACADTRPVTIEKGGRLPAHTHPGIEWIYVLQGTVDLRMAGGTRLILTRGQTGGVPPGTVVQAINAGETTVKILAHLLTLEGAPFQTNVDTAP